MRATAGRWALLILALVALGLGAFISLSVTAGARSPERVHWAGSAGANNYDGRAHSPTPAGEAGFGQVGTPRPSGASDAASQGDFSVAPAVFVAADTADGAADTADGAPDTAAGGVVRHYTTDAAADSISKEGVLRPGASGKTWLTPDEYASGAEARAKLALNKTPDGYYEIPTCRVQCPSGPSTVEPYYGQPGGGTEITTEYPIDVGDLPFIRFGGN